MSSRRRTAILALAALCALAVGAVAATGAQAAGATAFTCVEGGSEDFSDAHCTEGGGGSYGHVAIAEDETTNLTVTATSEQKLSSEVFGANIEFRATGLECEGCSVHNHKTGEVHEVTGSGGRVVFTGLTSNFGCEVEDPVSGPETLRTEPLQFTTTSVSSVTITPVSGETVAVLHLTGEGCPLPGEFPITGYVTGTLNGATLEIETGEGELGLAFTGEPFYLTGNETLSAGKEGEHHPIALTEGGSPPTPQEGTTAFTCVKGGGTKDFAGAHCDEAVKAGSGEYGHASIKKGEAKAIELTNAATKGETGEATPATIEASVAGVEATIVAAEVSGTGTIENYEPKADVHAVRGEATLEYGELEVEAPSGCSLAGPLKATTTFEAVEEGEAMGIEFAPKSGSTFLDLSFEGKECELADITAHVTGSVTSTGGAGGTAKGSGATLVLEAAHESLAVGKGEASIASTMTMRLKSGNPVALTTVE